MSKSTKLANAIRFLSIDAVNRANSGHPGAPMGMADMAVSLWKDHLNFNPKNPNWINRDRFILSNGHASMLLYSVLHLTGYDISIEDLKNFRKLHAKTPGHPERDITPGVETTTGPLGQGIATAVGMAIAERILSAQFNRDSFNIIDHYTYVFLGDGCLMEGISHEACSLAGTHKLNKLIVLYDDNGISIDGPVKPWFSENIAERFSSYGWNIIDKIDGHNQEQVSKAIDLAKQSDKPSIICCKTTIGYGSPKAGSEKSHGSPLGIDERSITAKNLDWNYKPFEIPEDIYQAWNNEKNGILKEEKWQKLFNQYQSEHPDLAKELIRRINGDLPTTFNNDFNDFINEQQISSKNNATRKSSEITLDFIGAQLSDLVGGSADLTGSNNTKHISSNLFSINNPGGNYISYGVREFAMSAIMNGLAVYGGFIPYAGTFLVFSDYARNAMRLSSLMQQRIIYIMTHDSIGLGEDGPTHQPIEHLSSLRLIPNMNVWRPCDGVETAVAWKKAILNNQGPSTLALSRQGLEKIPRNKSQISDIEKGGYTLHPGEDITLIATGSEVGVAMQTKDLLKESGIMAQVVSMPCYEIYKKQSINYQQQVILKDKPRIVIEAGSTHLWHSIVKGNGFIVGIDCFGESAPANILYPYFGLDAKTISEQIKMYLNK